MVVTFWTYIGQKRQRSKVTEGNHARLMQCIAFKMIGKGFVLLR